MPEFLSPHHIEKDEYVTSLRVEKSWIELYSCGVIFWRKINSGSWAASAFHWQKSTGTGFLVLFGIATATAAAAQVSAELRFIDAAIFPVSR